jgi:hypothetical protein
MKISKVQTAFIMLMWFPILVPYLLSAILVTLPHLFCRRVTTDKELAKLVKKWQNYLDISELVIQGAIDPTSNLSSSDMKEYRKVYTLTIAPKMFSDDEATVLHELVHIKKGHTDLQEENNPFFKVPINMLLDTVANLL